LPEPSRSVKTSTIRASGPNNSIYASPSGKGELQSTSSRRESTATARPHVSNASNAVPSSANHPSLPTEPRSSTVTAPLLSAAPVRPLPEKNEPDHSVNGQASATRELPPLPPSGDTQYVNMLLALDSIPQIHNIMAGFFTWILLAGFVLFPGTFTSLQANQGGVGGAVIGAIQHLPLFIIAWICTGVGAIGMCWLWYRWQANYIWLVNRIFFAWTT